MSSAKQTAARRNAKKAAAATPSDQERSQKDDQENPVDETDDGPESAPGDMGEGPDSPRRASVSAEPCANPIALRVSASAQTTRDCGACTRARAAARS